MQKTIYFHGPIYEYWGFMRLACMRLGMRGGGNGAFRYTHRKRYYSYWDYENSQDNNPKGIIFLDNDQKFPVITVFAEIVSAQRKPLSEQKIELTVYYEKDAYKKIGSTALSDLNKLLEYMRHDDQFEFPPLRRQPAAKRAPQQETINAINRLCQIRLEAIKDGHSIPTKIGAMQAAEITFKTVQHYAPELLTSWRDKNYTPEKWE